jgi:hypothetical protein
MHRIALLTARSTGGVLGWIITRVGPEWRPYFQLAGLDVERFIRPDPAPEPHEEPASAPEVSRRPFRRGAGASRSRA